MNLEPARIFERTLEDTALSDRGKEGLHHCRSFERIPVSLRFTCDEDDLVRVNLIEVGEKVVRYPVELRLGVYARVNQNPDPYFVTDFELSKEHGIYDIKGSCSIGGRIVLVRCGLLKPSLVIRFAAQSIGSGIIDQDGIDVEHFNLELIDFIQDGECIRGSIT